MAACSGDYSLESQRRAGTSVADIQRGLLIWGRCGDGYDSVEDQLVSRDGG